MTENIIKPKRSRGRPKNYHNEEDRKLAYNASVISKPDHPPWGFAHSSCPWGRVFAPLSCLGVCPGGKVLHQSKSSIISKKARFLLCLLNK